MCDNRDPNPRRPSVPGTVDKKIPPRFGVASVTRTSAAMLPLSEGTIIGSGAPRLAASVAASGNTGINARPSWGLLTVQYVDDRDHARVVARAAGRRTVRKYGEALE